MEELPAFSQLVRFAGLQTEEAMAARLDRTVVLHRVDSHGALHQLAPGPNIDAFGLRLATLADGLNKLLRQPGDLAELVMVELEIIRQHLGERLGIAANKDEIEQVSILLGDFGE